VFPFPSHSYSFLALRYRTVIVQLHMAAIVWNRPRRRGWSETGTESSWKEDSTMTAAVLWLRFPEPQGKVFTQAGTSEETGGVPGCSMIVELSVPFGNVSKSCRGIRRLPPFSLVAEMCLYPRNCIASFTPIVSSPPVRTGTAFACPYACASIRKERIA
jgi:hypothetical protein